MSTVAKFKAAVSEHPWWLPIMLLLNIALVYMLVLIVLYLLGNDALYDDPLGLLALPISWYPPLLVGVILSVALTTTYLMYQSTFPKGGGAVLITVEEFKAQVGKALEESDDPDATARAICARTPGFTIRLPSSDCQCEFIYKGLPGGGVDITARFGSCHDSDPRLKQAIIGMAGRFMEVEASDDED